MTFDRELWQRARSRFDELVELDAGSRRLRLAAIGRDDPALAAAVERLLAADASAESSLDPYAFAPLPQQTPSGDPRDPLGLVGHTVSHFLVTGYVAAGGMGVVYQAEDVSLGRPVALKFPLPQQDLTEPAKDRFVQEARSAATLDHPNLCSVHEVGESEHGVFLAMPLYPGETLRQRVDRDGALPLAEALAVTRAITGGLAAAHAAGIVHRDLKPGNVMLLPDGGLKVLDFGLAKIRDISLTKSRTAFGTIGYVAPEQIRGRRVDERADLWAIGVMLYEMLTGTQPFRGDHEMAVLHAVLYDDPERIARPLGDSTAAEAEKAEALIAGLLQKNPEHRYPSAEALLADIDAVARGAAIAHRVPFWARSTGRRRVRGVLVPAAVVLALLAVPALFLLGRWTLSRIEGAGPPGAAAGSVAVLPFANVGNDSMIDHLSAGLTEELANALSGTPGVRVAPPSLAAALAQRGLDARVIAESLDVGAVVQGAVRRTGDLLTVEAQLLSAHDGTVLWRRTFEGRSRELAATGYEITQSVVDALSPEGTSSAASRATGRRPDGVAYDLYLRGRHAWRQQTRAALLQAVAFFEEAIEHDPVFAEAHAGLAATYLNLSNFGYRNTAEALARAEVAADRALALDPQLAEGHAARGFVLLSRLEFGAAEAALLSAIEANPSYTWAHHRYALLLLMLGRTDEALERNRQALASDPLSLPANATRGVVLVQSGDLAGAERELERALALAPDLPLTLYYLGVVRAALGDDASAGELLERAARQASDFTGMPGARSFVLYRQGRRREADSLLEAVAAESRRGNQRARVNLGFAHAALGRTDAAFQVFEGGVEWDVPALIELRADPLLAPLRADPRYPTLLRTIVATPVPATRSSMRPEPVSSR